MALIDPDSLPDSRPGLAWLVRLRWLAVIGQVLATVVATVGLDIRLSLAWVLGLVGVTAVSNVALMVVGRGASRPRALTAAVLALDTITLSGVLAASGGPMNPFSVCFIVQVALAGLLLGARGAWSMAAFTSLGFGVLFFIAPDDPHAQHHGASPGHLQGMWVAYTLAAGLVATFVSGIATALRRRERELAGARERVLETERLAALSSFSASAAHELGTPLGTIALVAGELAHRLTSVEGDGDLSTPAARAALIEDAHLVRREVERCKNLLREISERSGSWAGEAPEPIGPTEALQLLKEHLPLTSHERLSLSVPPALAGARMNLPRRSFVESLANLVKNGLEASSDEVAVTLVRDGDRATWRVSDHGAGFEPEVLARLGEPLVTTKRRGLGLGLHLVSSFADKVGGRLAVQRRGGRTEVELSVPATFPPAEVPP